MLLKTAAGKFAPLLAIGLAATVGGCSTQEDAQPPQFGNGPVVEAIYARDSAGAVTIGIGPLPDVQVWANPLDAHYPNQVGETGAQNAANVSPFPASYSSIVVEFNIPLDGTKLGAQNDLGSYCSIGADATKTPFTLTDVTSGSTSPLLGSVCYDPTSPLFRYPSLTYVLGQSVATDSSVNPFTCQAFNAEDWTDTANATALVPKHQYALKFNTALVTNDANVGFAAPTGDAAWSAGTFTFNASGFDIMAVGYQDQNTGYYVFLDKPYKGFLKDQPCAGSSLIPNGTCPAAAGAYQQPADDTALFVITTYGMDTDQNCVPANADGSNTMTATRSDGTPFDAFVFNDFCLGGIASFDPRIGYVNPGLAVPGFDGPAAGGSATWEPSQKYTVTVPADLATLSGDATLGTAPAPYTFSTTDGSPGYVAISPGNGSVSQLVVGANGPSTIPVDFFGATPFSSFTTSAIVVDYNVPLDTTLVTTDNFKVTAADGTAVAGTVAVVPNTDNQAIAFTPTVQLKPATVYTVAVSNLKADPADTAQHNAAIASISKTFTTATMRTQALGRTCVTYANSDGCAQNPATFASADRASNQPLQILHDGRLRLQFSEAPPAAPAAGSVSNTNVTITEVKADGTNGATLDPSTVTVTQVGPVRYYIKAADTYPIKCSQKYLITAATSITDANGVTLTAEGCKTAGGCPDLRSFTTAAFNPLPQDASGDLIGFVPAAAATATTPANPDTLTVEFNSSLSAATVNPLLQAGKLIQLSDANGAAVPITCPNLPDDNQTIITCTANSPLAANAVYVATMLVTSDAPLKIATATVLDPLSSYGTVFTPTTTFVGDQASCQYFGSTTLVFQTACPATSPRAPHRAVAGHHANHRGATTLSMR